MRVYTVYSPTGCYFSFVLIHSAFSLLLFLGLHSASYLRVLVHGAWCGEFECMLFWTMKIPRKWNQIRGEVIKVFEIPNVYEECRKFPGSIWGSAGNTGGHNAIFNKRHARTNITLQRFAYQVVISRNDLPEKVVAAPTSMVRWNISK